MQNNCYTRHHKTDNTAAVLQQRYQLILGYDSNHCNIIEYIHYCTNHIAITMLVYNVPNSHFKGFQPLSVS